MIKTNIENIVAYSKIASSFDIEFMSEKIPNFSYNPDEFDGLTMKFEDPKVAVLILSNGKLVCTGGKSLDVVNKSIDKAVEIIKKPGFEVKKDYETVIDNVVVSYDFDKPLDLEKISKGLLLKNVDYTPEQFPGLIYRADNFCDILLLFSSGKIVSTGAKSIDDANKAVNMMKDKLSSIGVL